MEQTACVCRLESKVTNIDTEGARLEMKRYKVWMVAVLVLTLTSLVTGCASFAPVLAGRDADPGGDPVVLDGTQWNLIEMNGTPVADPGKATLDFDAESAGGIGFCNYFFASYEEDGESLTIGDIGSTLMACPDLDLEGDYFAALDQVASSRREGDTLVLLNAEGDAVLIFEPAVHAALEGTPWLLTSMYTDRDSMSSLVWGVDATAVVEDGIIGGTTGCNHYSGEFTVDGNTVEVGELVQTEMYCTEPEGVMEQEASYLRWLTQVESYEIVRDRLTFFNAEGAAILNYVVSAE
jgi:heat shock protein HslJ